jgi:hypothetical protein
MQASAPSDEKKRQQIGSIYSHRATSRLYQELPIPATTTNVRSPNERTFTNEGKKSRSSPEPALELT